MKNCNCEGCELKNIFFENVNSQEIETLCSGKKEKSFKKGEIIIHEGEEIVEFTYLKEGLVKLFRKGANDREQIICFALPLDFVSLLSIFSAKKYNYSVTALHDSVICSMNLNEVKQLASENGKFAIDLMKKINKATDRIILDSLEVRQRRLFGRIAYILLYFSKEVFKKDIFEIPVSRKEIADYIGMTIENVIRALSEIRKDGIINIQGPVIEILDMKRLEKISDLS